MVHDHGHILNSHIPSKRRKKLEKVEELPHKIPSSRQLKKYYSVLGKLKEALKKKDVSKINKQYIKARKSYIDLQYQEKRQVYDELMQVYKQLNQLLKEKKIKKR